MKERVTPIEPATPYGQAKASLFELLDRFTPQMNLSFAWGRIFFPIGPGEKRGRMLPELMASLLDRRPMDLTDGTQFWDFMHVSDVAAAFITLLRSDVQGPVNIGSGKARPLREVMDGLTQRLGGGDLVNIGGRARATGEPPHIGADVTRLVEEVGFRPVYGWEDTLDDLVAWARLQNHASAAAS